MTDNLNGVHRGSYEPEEDQQTLPDGGKSADTHGVAVFGEGSGFVSRILTENKDDVTRRR